MKRFLLLFIQLILPVIGALAQGEHYVRPYYRKDGSYVPGHYRTNPNNTINDNYSTYPNVNPHTGKVGTIPPSSFSVPNTTNYPTYSTTSPAGPARTGILIHGATSYKLSFPMTFTAELYTHIVKGVYYSNSDKKEVFISISPNDIDLLINNKHVVYKILSKEYHLDPMVPGDRYYLSISDGKRELSAILYQHTLQRFELRGGKQKIISDRVVGLNIIDYPGDEKNIYEKTRTEELNPY